MRERGILLVAMVEELYVQGFGQHPIVELCLSDDGERCGPEAVTAVAGMARRVHWHRLADGRLAGPFMNVDGLSVGVCPSQKGS